jgi:hypothetical protein
MYDRFTGQARKVMELAEEAAELLKEESGVAANLLKRREKEAEVLD